MRILPMLFATLPILAQSAPSKPVGPVRVTVNPKQVWIEAGDTAQAVNFDFILENQGDAPLGIDKIEVTAFDAAGKPVLRRFIDGNGFAPSIETIPERVLAPKATLLLFNPFHTFRPDVDLHRLVYTFGLSIPKEAPETSVTVTVEPRRYRGQGALSLPLKGRLLVHDGHDFYAHHRRLNTQHPAAQQFGLTQNFMRYSLDLNTTNQAFEPFKGEGARNEDWYAWGQPLYAAGDGTVVAAGDGEPDNIRGGQNFFNPGALAATPMKFYGNYVVIDHGHGEFSLLGHLQKGSVTVKAGDRVKRGQAVAKVGSSGSSNNPHVHFELRNGVDLKCDGLPATFHDFKRHLGSQVLDVKAGPLDTGDMVESR